MSLRHMFTDVAGKYELLNRLLTLGLDKRWREVCARESASGRIVVDLCCGTGDLSFQILSRLTPSIRVVGLDFNKEMLGKAMERKSKWRQSFHYSVIPHGKTIDGTDLIFVLADAAHLPIRDRCIDRVGTSFSFRNLIYKNPKAMTYLKEIVRVLQHKGKFVCVETSQPTDPFIKVLFHLYCLRIVPLIGWLISGNRGAYKYLGRSAASFPDAQSIVAMLKRAGFQAAFFKRLSHGIVALYVATKQ